MSEVDHVSDDYAAFNEYRKGKVLPYDQFAALVSKITDNDYESIIVIDGEKGAGKSCLSQRLAVAINNCKGLQFDLNDCMTWERNELREWINPGQKQKPEFMAVIVEELITMFFNREWRDDEQNDGIKLLNMCRDRHLTTIGNSPAFWELDKAFRTQVRFWIHIYKRGSAWVFKKDRNPFTRDKWCQELNLKLFWKHHNPYFSPNFVCTISWPDWTPEEYKAYYAIRNTKRVGVENQRKVVRDSYEKIRAQRDSAIKYAIVAGGISHSDLARFIGVHHSLIGKIVYNDELSS